MTYTDYITQFLFETIPTIGVAEDIRFEAIVKEVFGTKQRRNGPMPTPEDQIKIRQVIRDNEVIQFFLPWGSRKQVDSMGLDVLDFCAIKQLRCLQEGLKNFGKRCKFSFRIEDLTDHYLFDGIIKADYSTNLKKIISLMLDKADPRLESEQQHSESFKPNVDIYMPIFYKYLCGKCPVSELESIGWVGTIPPAQREYYEKAYNVFYPDKDVNVEMAKYFAATLARVKLGLTCVPVGDYIMISFCNPVPCNPVGKSRIYYRSIPERYTHLHQAPWIGKGYFIIYKNGECVPKCAGIGNGLVFNKNNMEYGKAMIECDYILGD